MAVCVGDLDQRQLERLRIEVGETLAAQLAYPPFFDFHLSATRVRPIDPGKREEIDQFVRSANFSQIERADVSSPDVRRFLERLCLRYLDVNPAVRRPSSSRRLPQLRSRVPRIARDIQRGLVEQVSGGAPSFGARRPPISWAATTRHHGSGQDDAVQHHTRILEATLLRRDADQPTIAEEFKPSTSPIGGVRSGAAAVPSAVSAVSAAPHVGWSDGMTDATVPVPAHGFPLSGGASPFAGLETGTQSSVFGGTDALAEAATGPLVLPTGMGAPPSESTAAAQQNGMGSAPRELPADLYQLYGDFLRDMQPEIAGEASSAADAPTATLPVMAAPQPPVAPAAPRPISPHTAVPASASGTSEDGGDKHIFWQLRYQLEAYVRRAARSYGVPAASVDPSNVLDALRRSGFVDEADLRIAEGILALTDRVTVTGAASVEEYRQALMLYLLYHRSHLGA